MRTWKIWLLHTGRCCFPAGPLLAVAVLFVAAACGIPPSPSLPPRLPVYRHEWCSAEELGAVAEVPAPRLSVPGNPGCIVQLQILPDKAQYDRGDFITVTVRLSKQGDCTLDFITTYDFFDFPPVEFLNQSGETVPLTPEGQVLSDRHMAFLDMKKGGMWSAGDESSCYRLPIAQWYDLAAPGTYTLTLGYGRFIEMREAGPVISNPITFTRRP